VRASFECRVLNTMDAGAATFVLGDVVDVRQDEAGDVMTSTWFRQHAPPDLLREYDANLAYAQAILEPISRDIDAAGWPGPVTGP
jgi:flavin reductase (DIM6/NTAB) family NADH-FMN oxidoreductase RutF